MYCDYQVEHIIREDYLVEAMEMLELYCDLLLARFGLIETQQWVQYSRFKTLLLCNSSHCTTIG